MLKRSSGKLSITALSSNKALLEGKTAQISLQDGLNWLAKWAELNVKKAFLTLKKAFLNYNLLGKSLEGVRQVFDDVTCDKAFLTFVLGSEVASQSMQVHSHYASIRLVIAASQ